MRNRVFLGLGDICGYYSQLERGLTAIGVPCTFVNAYPDRNYGRLSRPGFLGRIVEWIAQRRARAKRGSVNRLAWSVIQVGGLTLLLFSTLFTCDAFVFSGGTTFLFGRELCLLKLFRKTIVVVFHGSDSRPPYLNGAVVGTESDFDVDACVRESWAIKDRLRHIERYADFIINHSMSSHFHEKPIINWLYLGIPREATSHAGSTSRPDCDVTVIVHAPTRPGPKGTARIEAAIASLQRKGHAVRLVKMVDQPHAAVLEALSQCDFVVDELFSDTTMASFAAEAAAFGKPAIVGMYGFQRLRQYTNAEQIPPALVCDPDDVESAIEKLVVDVEYRLDLGARARRFIEGQWDAAFVAQRFVRLLEGDAPPHWWFDPHTIEYLHGWGLTDQRAREVIRLIVEKHGVAALALADKPRLEQAFADFAHGCSTSDGSERVRAAI